MDNLLYDYRMRVVLAASREEALLGYDIPSTPFRRHSTRLSDKEDSDSSNALR
jgi:hypothetical protein